MKKISKFFIKRRNFEISEEMLWRISIYFVIQNRTRTDINDKGKLRRKGRTQSHGSTGETLGLPGCRSLLPVNIGGLEAYTLINLLFVFLSFDALSIF